MKKKDGQNKMAVVDLSWFVSPENLEKLSDEELIVILRELEELIKRKRGDQAGGASG